MRKLHALAAGRTARAANSAAVAVSARQRLLQPVDPPSVRLRCEPDKLLRHLDVLQQLHPALCTAVGTCERLLQPVDPPV